MSHSTTDKAYDVIVVGARCAGAPTAMLLARKGYRLLLVDRARFPSDTVSTHVVHPRAIAALARWGLLDRLTATSCPHIHTYAYDFGPFTIEGAPGTKDSPVAYCPRRTVLDKLLVDAAVEAGADLREGFNVDDVLIEEGRVIGVRTSSGGRSMAEIAHLVIGADGRTSSVAEATGAPRYNEKPALLAIYYAYWSGLPMHGRFETYIRPHRGFAAADTNDGLTMIVAGWPRAEFGALKSDTEGSFRSMFELVPTFAERVRSAKRETRFAGAITPNFFRTPYGPGWALVGDAGYIKDPITGQGIMDAFRDAERCVAAVDEALSGKRSYDAAMRDYQLDRDLDVLAMYDFTYMLAALEPPPPDLQQLLAAVHGNQWAMDAFAQTNAGTLSPGKFFAPEHVNAILGASGGASGGNEAR
jgi:2-polyprenyl-6-methoxyphenol hydroxylase-like FAD-dependent oxidoreductase